MYSIKVNLHFDAAHFLKDYNGKCSNIHGHRWNIEVIIFTKELKEYGSNKGMVEDFADLKRDINTIISCYDHSLIVENGSMKQATIDCLRNEGFKLVFVDFRTTAENFAYYIYSTIAEKGYAVKSVTVYETPNNGATYEN